MTSKTNSKGKTYFLHSRDSRYGGGKLYFFSSKQEGEIELDSNKYEIIENEKTHLPLVKKKAKV